MRELILGPRRFTELQQGLPGIGTDILTARLRALEDDDVVRRIGKGRAQRYELTDRGRALRPVLVALAHWGAERLELPADPDDVSPRVALTSLLLDPPPLPTAARITVLWEAWINSDQFCAPVLVNTGVPDAVFPAHL